MQGESENKYFFKKIQNNCKSRLFTILFTAHTKGLKKQSTFGPRIQRFDKRQSYDKWQVLLKGWVTWNDVLMSLKLSSPGRTGADISASPFSFKAHTQFVWSKCNTLYTLIKVADFRLWWAFCIFGTYCFLDGWAACLQGVLRRM